MSGQAASMTRKEVASVITKLEHNTQTKAGGGGSGECNTQNPNATALIDKMHNKKK